MADVYALARRYRKNVLDAEAATLAPLIERYGQAFLALTEEADRFHSKIAARARELGVSIEDVAKTDPSWPFRAGNLDDQRSAIAKRMADLASRGQIATESLQGMGVRMGIDHAKDLTAESGAQRLVGRAAQQKARTAILGAWNRPNTEAIEALIGLTADGTPLSELFIRAAGGSAEEMTNALLTGFTLGQGPRAIADVLKKSLGGNLTRALRIARTETIRSYRLANQASFQANPDIVQGWVWHSALDPRTCIACIERHGSIHPVTEILSDHVQGRCAMVPRTPSWKELGDRFGVDLSDVPETALPIETGADWLARQAPGVQAKILGTTRFDLYRKGTGLDEMVAVVDDPIWGSSVRVRPAAHLTTGTPTKVPKPIEPKTTPLPVTPEPPQIDRAGYVIDVTDTTPAWVRELSDEVGTGVTDHEHAIRAGAIVELELAGRLDEALKAVVSIEAPEAIASRARIARLEAQLKKYRRQKWESAVTSTQEAIDAERAILEAAGPGKTGTLADLHADLQAQLNDLDRRREYLRPEGSPISIMTQAELIEYRALGEQAAKVRQARMALHEIEDDIRQRVVKEVLAEVRPTDDALQNWSKGGSAAVRNAVEDDIAHLFPRSWLEKSATSTPMKTSIGARGRYTPGRPPWSYDGIAKLKTDGDLGTQRFMDTIAHELGHRVEDEVRGVSQRVEILTRASGENAFPGVTRATVEAAGVAWDDFVRTVAMYEDDDAARAMLRRVGVDEALIEESMGRRRRLVPIAEEQATSVGILDLEQMLYKDWTAGVAGKRKDGGVFRATRDGVADWPIGYAGKSYPRPGGGYYFFEIFTTGVEAVRGGGVYRYGTDRIPYADVNPDLWRFVLGVLVGVP